jgi:prolyl 4-hydroxylase
MQPRLQHDLTKSNERGVAATLYDHIMVAPNALAREHCQRLIDRFEASAEIETCQREGAYSFTQLHLTSAWPDEHQQLMPIFVSHLRKYQERTQATYWPPTIAFENLRMKRYLPDGRDGFPPHVDVMTQSAARRFMTAILYLNAPDGGETVFPHLDLSISPETGKLLAFPPLWLFPHAGLPPRSEPKYILHTYLCYAA